MPNSLLDIKPRATLDLYKDINWSGATTGELIKNGHNGNAAPQAEKAKDASDKVDISPEAKEKDKDEHQHDNPLMKWAHGLTKGWL